MAFNWPLYRKTLGKMGSMGSSLLGLNINRDLFKTHKVDKTLEEKLKEAGMTSRLNELKGLYSKTGTGYKGIASSLGKTISRPSESIGNFIGASNLGKAYGASIGSGELLKQKRREIQTTYALSKIVSDRLKQGNLSESESTRYKSLLRDTQKSLGGISNTVVGQTTQGVTTKGIMGDAAQLALLASFGYKPTGGLLKPGALTTGRGVKAVSQFRKASQGINAANRARKYGKLGSAANIATKYGKPALSEGAIGAGLVGASEYGRGEKTNKEIGKDMLKYGAIFGLASPAIGLASKGIGKMVGTAGSELVGKPLQKALQRLELIANPTYKSQAGKASDITEKILARTDQGGLKQKTAQNILRVTDFVGSIPSKITNIYHAMYRIDQRLKRIGAGKSATIERNFRLANPAADSKAEYVLDDLFGKQLKPYQGIKKDIEARAHVLDDIDRATLRNTTPQGGVIKNEAERQAVLAELKEQLQAHISVTTSNGSEKQIQEALKILNKHNDDLLKGMVESGLISKKEYGILKETHPNYVPHDVMQSQIKKGSEAMYGAGSLNPQKGIAKATGSEKLIAPAFDANADNTLNVYRNIEKNEATKALVKAQEEFGTINGMRALVTAEDVIARRALLRRLYETKIQLKKQLRTLRSEKNFNKEVDKKLTGLIDEIDELGKSTNDELNKFLGEPAVAERTTAEISMLQKIPNELQKQKIIAKKQAKDVFLGGNQLLKEFEDGTLQKYGFQTRESFWNAANGIPSGGGGNVVTEKVTGSLSKAVGDIRKADVVGESKTITEFSKISSDDAIRLAEDTINNIKTDRASIYKEFLARSAGKSQTGEKTINMFRDGVKETWVVPNDIAEAVKNLNSESLSKIVKFFATPVQWLKAGATRYNLSFTATNLLRDKQTAMVTTDSFINAMAKQMGVEPKLLNLTKKEIRQLFFESGAGQASIFAEGKPADTLKALKAFKNGNIKTYAKEANPLSVINKINESVENSTRFSVFEKALASGLAPKDAALIARNATVDFAKMGTWMQNLNQLIPFLNARTQGIINVGSALKMSPEIFARKQMLTAVYPTLGLYQWNRQFETYKNIDQHIKKNYHVVVVGEKDGVDIDGKEIKVAQYLSFKKGEAQALVSNPVQWFIEKQDGINNQSVTEMLTDTIGSASPININQFGNQNPWLSLAAQSPLTSIPTGLATNIDPYRGSYIIPQDTISASDKSLQTRKNTPKLIEKWAGKLNMPPAQLEFIVNSFGGGPQDVVKVADMIVNNEEKKDTTLTSSKFGEISQYPITKRFIREAGEYGSPAREANREEIWKEKGELKTESLILKGKAQSFLDGMKEFDTKEERLNYLKSLGDQLTPEVKKRMTTLKSSNKTIDDLKPGDPVDIRAMFILREVYRIKSSGGSADEILEYTREMEKAGILTEGVKKAILILKNNLSQ